MIDLTGVTHHPAIEEVVDVLCDRTQNTDRGFFRTEMAYFLGRMASSMRATVNVPGRGEMPVNVYALALATSGYGKGWSVGIIEDEFLKGFNRRFKTEAFPTIAEKHLWEIANENAARNGGDQNEEFKKVERSFHSVGAVVDCFDSGTAPAIKQYRVKMLMAKIGALNMQIDEIGSNLANSEEILNVYLELYDKGAVKQKLVKNTTENQRHEDYEGNTPCNMLLFGTPVKLLDGSTIEDKFYSFLETGYARRCLFGWGKQDSVLDLTPAQMLANLKQPKIDSIIKHWSNHFHTLADPAMYGWKMEMADDVMLQFLTYEVQCKQASAALGEHEEIRKAEVGHRHSKALKLAGALAFCDQSLQIEMEHLLQAILLTEESGTAFQQILHREKPYEKLAKYISSVETEVTHPDLNALPFYPKAAGARSDMLTLATAWGYKNNIIIKKSFVDGIEFFRGESLKETSLEEIRVAYSDHFAFNYLGEVVPFDQLHNLTQAPGMHWTNHHFKGNHRNKDNVLPGFNMVVVDVDGGVKLDTVHDLLKEYTFLTYTTKRHDPNGEHRFRLLLPINYNLTLDRAEYKEFMDGVMSWLPFRTETDAVDESANQPERKWMSCETGTYHYNQGDLVDALPFIPKTKKNEDFRQQFQALESLDNLERWFAQRIAQGNRNNNLIKYALALVDGGLDLQTVANQVFAFNSKLNNGLPESEIETTILTTVAKRYQP